VEPRDDLLDSGQLFARITALKDAAHFELRLLALKLRFGLKGTGFGILARIEALGKVFGESPSQSPLVRAAALEAFNSPLSGYQGAAALGAKAQGTMLPVGEKDVTSTTISGEPPPPPAALPTWLTRRMASPPAAARSALLINLFYWLVTMFHITLLIILFCWLVAKFLIMLLIILFCWLAAMFLIMLLIILFCLLAAMFLIMLLIFCFVG
jgi:hypothetical protein